MSNSDSSSVASENVEVPQDIVDLVKRVSLQLTTELRPTGFSVFTMFRNAISNILTFLRLYARELKPDEHVHVELLAQGGYNDVWLVNSKQSPTFVLRMPSEDTLKPNQILNEVGWLKYMSKHCVDIPVPKVYDYSHDIDANHLPFIAEQYVDAKSLADVWSTYMDSEKEEVARKLAELVVRLGEVRFDAIQGMNPDGSPAPTVEGCTLFKGRDAFHAPAYYDIGPYRSIKEYILAYYDKEIYYYSHAGDEVIDMDFFDDITLEDFVQTLREKRASIEVELEVNPRNEPFVLCHNDLKGRNILMQGTKIMAVIDWEFAGAFPLSEQEGDGIEVLEMDDGELVDECFLWSDKIAKLVGEVARERGWAESDVQLLTSHGDPVLQAVRVEMIPEMPQTEE